MYSDEYSDEQKYSNEYSNEEASLHQLSLSGIVIIIIKYHHGQSPSIIINHRQ
jgi:hypothetical protein